MLFFCSHLNFKKVIFFPKGALAKQISLQEVGFSQGSNWLAFLKENEQRNINLRKVFLVTMKFMLLNNTNISAIGWLILCHSCISSSHFASCLSQVGKKKAITPNGNAFQYFYIVLEVPVNQFHNAIPLSSKRP